MAREWSLVETKALVEEHIALKEEEKADSVIRTASEHWNKVAKRLREKGFDRSHKSCNKRWYRLEQFEVQIVSFNMEEHKNFWDLTKTERLEFRHKFPQLPSGDGIDKEIFDSLNRFSHQYDTEKKLSKKEVTMSSPSETVMDHVPDKEVEPKVELTRQSLAPSPATRVSPPFAYPMLAVLELKRQEDSSMADSKTRMTWPPGAPHPPLSSQESALDGFKLQARELRRRRAAELRRNNRTVPYNSTHTTFMKAVTQLNAQNSELPPRPVSENPLGFGAPNPISSKTSHQNTTQPGVMDTMDSNHVSKPPFQLKRPNPFTDQVPHHRYAPAQPQPQCQEPGLSLQSMNAHMPLLQPDDQGVMSQQQGTLEEQLQVILGVNHGTHGGPSSATASVLGTAIGGLGLQLGAIVKLMQAKHAAEQEFRDKMLIFVECMVVSLRTIAQVSARTGSAAD